MARHANPGNGHHNGHQNPPPMMPPPPATDPNFVAAGDFFDDATTRLVGGISPDFYQQIFTDLTTAQNELITFYNNHAEIQNTVAGIHTQEIIHSLNLEIEAVGFAAGNRLDTHLGDFVERDINDFHRDLIDIVQGDNVLLGFLPGGAGGFSPLPPVLNGPAPFADNAEQAAFVNQFVADANNLSQQAIATVQAGGDPAALIAQLQAFAANADAFSVAQGNQYSARFDNELRIEGNNGVATNELIRGLQTGNADLVQAASEVLVANAADFAGNNTAGNAATPTPTPVAQAAAPADAVTFDHVAATAPAQVAAPDAPAVVAPAEPAATTATPAAVVDHVDMSAVVAADQNHHSNHFNWA